MTIVIEDPLDWCHKHNATVQFHRNGSVTLTVEGYITQVAYSLVAAINSCQKRMDENNQAGSLPTAPDQNKYYDVTWWKEGSSIRINLRLPLSTAQRVGSVEEAIRYALNDYSPSLRFFYAKNLVDRDGNEIF
jgi:hypothetical protein